MLKKNEPVEDRPVKAACYALMAVFLVSTMGMLFKVLALWLGPVEIAFYRNLVSFVLLLLSLVLWRQLGLLKTQRWRAHMVRAFVGTTGMLCIIKTYSLMPLATATVLIFTAPLFVVLLSYPLLKEKVGPFRILATFAGFGGVAFMCMGEDLHITAEGLLFGLAGGFFNALVSISLRWLGQTENSRTTNFYFLLFGLIGTGLAMPFISGSASVPEYIQIYVPGLFLILGSVGLVSLILKTKSFRLGSAALISPISYTLLIWAALYDYFIWGVVITAPTIYGALIIITSNLFILYRENRQKLKQAIA